MLAGHYDTVPAQGNGHGGNGLTQNESVGELFKRLSADSTHLMRQEINRGGGIAGLNEGMQTAGEGRGTDSVGEEGISGEATTGPIEQEDVGLPGGAIGAAEDEQGAPDAATMGTGGTGDAIQ